MKIKVHKALPQQLSNIFHLLNYVQPNPDSLLTDTEIDVLSSICLLPSKYEYARFSATGKRKAIEICKEVFGSDYTKANFNNKVYSLIKKGYCERDEDNIIYLKDYIVKILKSITTHQKFEINIEFNVEGS